MLYLEAEKKLNWRAVVTQKYFRFLGIGMPQLHFEPKLHAVRHRAALDSLPAENGATHNIFQPGFGHIHNFIVLKEI